jgi:Zn-finger nucleic acid-binding protein
MTLADCPSCGSAALVQKGNQLDCQTCHGCFVESSRLEAMVEEMTRAPFRLDGLRRDPGTQACPRCHSAMDVIELFEVAAARCRHHGVWFAAGGLVRALQSAGGAKPAPLHGGHADPLDPYVIREPRDLEAIEPAEPARPLARPVARPAGGSPVVGQSPYRDLQLACPACAEGLRRFRDRLCCDGCNGIMLGITDLAVAIHELTGAAPQLGFTSDAPGARACPCCQAAMVRCRLDVRLLDERPELRPELDRCDGHGVWFDAEELAKVFEVLRRLASTTFGSTGRPWNLIGRT